MVDLVGAEHLGQGGSQAWGALNSRTPLAVPGEACHPQPWEVAGVGADSPAGPGGAPQPAEILYWSGCCLGPLFMKVPLPSEEAMVRQRRTAADTGAGPAQDEPWWSGERSLKVVRAKGFL